MVKKAKKKFKTPQVKAIKIDLGCGPNKREGFTGVDRLPFDGKVDVVLDMGKDRWPWKDGSVEEAHCSHAIEHLDWDERVHFMNELFRVLKQGSKCTLIFPHWSSARFYGDPTHKAPMSEFAFYYLLKAWRDANAPHVPYTCDFDVTWGYVLDPELSVRAQEVQQHATKNFREAIWDVVATLVKK